MAEPKETSLGDAITFGIVFGLGVSVVGGGLAFLTLWAFGVLPPVSVESVAVDFVRFFAVWTIMGAALRLFSVM